MQSREMFEGEIGCEPPEPGTVRITVDDMTFDVLADHYAKRGFAALPTTPTMSACEILAMRGQDTGYWLQEEDESGSRLRVWRDQNAPGLTGPFEGPTTQAIILRDGMRFGSFPPAHFGARHPHSD